LKEKHNIVFNPKLHQVEEYELLDLQRKKEELIAKYPDLYQWPKEVIRSHKQTDPVQCNLCDMTLNGRDSLYAHRQNKHPEDVKRKKKKEPKLDERRVDCNLCDKSFSGSTSLYVHRQRKHPEAIKRKEKKPTVL
jgi:Zinc finger, C2H2 type